MHHDVVCLGGGVTGLAVGWNRDLPVFEARGTPGGICASYYLDPQHMQRASRRPEDGGGFRFEIGGGHWIFGRHPQVSPLLHRLAPMRQYRRRASIFLGTDRPRVPYPVQFHLSHLGEPDARKALAEIEAGLDEDALTMADWLRRRFGETLTALFFGPFHELYSAGLWTSIAPQDGYKSPLRLDSVREGARGGHRAAGYNVTFAYPSDGLDTLCGRFAAGCDLRYEHEVVGIDVDERIVSFSNGSSAHYDRLISTLPLVSMSQWTGLDPGEAPDPYTSVLVLNIGAARGPALPDDHWIYFPSSKSGFHRVGIYSNVDAEFLPLRLRAGRTACALYVERSYAAGERPDEPELRAYVRAVIAELRALHYIGDVEVCDPTWIPVAYTWRRPGSTWSEAMQRTLREHGIEMAGRYGRWRFQGVTDSIGEGLQLGTSSSAAR